jgi:hypothetical protein
MCFISSKTSDVVCQTSDDLNGTPA